VEAVFERFLWKLRLIAILPVIMSLASTGVTFVLGTLEIGRRSSASAMPRMPLRRATWPNCWALW
jgi:hypothetical protein